ncbi:low molecular weight phosphatase family protein [Anditalea andensis]|uniref:Protein tyrosine phosphatase n=1 Tax=Anditalea andensis TaxID=1048983 RepID=A0A074LEG1_9BACT|nr:protein-tyrosine-phosphatase [Anditalea andensis]KEO72157.1 protein tyrosine phosphatase [Anditalea andensis]
MQVFPELANTIEKAKALPLSTQRKDVLQELIDYIQGKKEIGAPVQLNFICTHNSRRSQFSQIWAQTMAYLHGIAVFSYSGGVEVTAFNERAVASVGRAGFKTSAAGDANPKVAVKYADHADPIIAFSKTYDDPANPEKGFAAVMTCSHADENCPFIAGAEARIPVRYEDPKAFDDTEQEEEKYDERSLQIASEMNYVFSQIK